MERWDNRHMRTQQSGQGEFALAHLRNQKEIAKVEEAEPLDKKVLDQLIREGKPNVLTSLFVDRPFCVLLVGFLTLFAISGVSFALGYFALTP